MGMVRRRTRRRTMMVAGGLAYERGRRPKARRRPAPQPAYDEPPPPRRRPHRRRQSSTTASEIERPRVAARLGGAHRRGVRRGEAERHRHLAVAASEHRGASMAENSRGAALRRAIETCISTRRRRHRRSSATLFTDDVTVWSPNLLGGRSRRPGREPRHARGRRSPTSRSRSTPSASSGTRASPSSASRPPSRDPS